MIISYYEGHSGYANYLDSIQWRSLFPQPTSFQISTVYGTGYTTDYFTLQTLYLIVRLQSASANKRQSVFLHSSSLLILHQRRSDRRSRFTSASSVWEALIFCFFTPIHLIVCLSAGNLRKIQMDFQSPFWEITHFSLYPAKAGTAVRVASCKNLQEDALKTTVLVSDCLSLFQIDSFE